MLYEIESYESTLRTFDDQIAYSSVHLSIQEVQRETTVEKETAGQEIARRFKENWEDVKDGFARFGIDFVSDLPIIIVWVVFLGIVVLVIVRIVKGGPKRKARRERQREKAAEKEKLIWDNGDSHTNHTSQMKFFCAAFLTRKAACFNPFL